MADAAPQFIDVAGRRIAVRITAPPHGGAPGLFWLPGFRSDMDSTKATALAEFAAGRYGCTRFDYSGHGLSGGAFEDGTVGTWLADAQAAFAVAPGGRQIVVGSSMGGYIALVLLRRLLVSDPAAAEQLMWRAFTPYQQAALMAEGQYLRPSEYGEPYPITRALIEEGRSHLMADQPADPGRPVYILQGLMDDAVPPAHTRRLLELLPGRHVTMEEIADGDHRLSRPQDIARLIEVVTRLAERAVA
jgi:pimeloyl-ACP methyl ester carboxylesterase